MTMTISSRMSLLYLLFLVVSLYWTVLCLASDESQDHVLLPIKDADDDGDDPRSTTGVDVSWPMHRIGNRHSSVEERERRSRRYVQFMQGCALHYDNNKDKDTSCQTSDEERMSMIRNQPPLMQNYTSAGYAKVPAPSHVIRLLQDFYHEHHEDRQVTEHWAPGNAHINHWTSPTKMLPLAGFDHDPSQPALTLSQRHTVISEIQSILETWCKMPLLPTSLYGIRIYQRGAILAPHVDRLPLVISAVINVMQSGLQQEEDDWPLEIIDHNGVAVNITLKEGEMVRRNLLVCRLYNTYRGEFVFGLICFIVLVFSSDTIALVRRCFGDSWSTLSFPWTILCQCLSSL
jgi:hypothetical protein